MGVSQAQFQFYKVKGSVTVFSALKHGTSGMVRFMSWYLTTVKRSFTKAPLFFVVVKLITVLQPSSS